MKNSQLLKSLIVVSSLWCLAIEPVLANDGKQERINSQLEALAKPSIRAADLLAQDANPTAVKITGVKLNPTSTGLEVILETATGAILKPVNRNEGNTLIADIDNAVLALPEQSEFKAENPAAGVSAVTVTQLLDGQTARVTVVGSEALPIVTVKGSEATTAQQPVQPELEEGEEEIVATGEQETGYRVRNSTTGTKTDTPLRDIPQSIQVIPKEVLQDRAIIRIGDAVQNVSGVNYLGGYQGFSERFSVRGFQNFFNIFRDGIRVDGYTSYLETTDLERIEVLKGPASVLFGDAEPGGIINLVSKLPLRDPFYRAEATFGSYSTYQGSLDLSGPLNSNKSALYRFNGYYENSGSFRDFVEAERLFLAPKLKFALGEKTFLTLDLTWTNETRTPDDGIPAIGNRPANLPRNRFLGEPFQNIKSNVFSAGYLLEHQFNDRWSINNIFRAQLVNLERYFPLFDSLDETTGELGRLRYFSERQDNAFSSQTNLIGKFSTGKIKHKLLLGFEYTKITEDGTFGDFEPYDSINIFNPTYDGSEYPKKASETFFRDDSVDKYGFYIQDQIEILPNLKLLAGGRFDIFRQTRTEQDLGQPKLEFKQTDNRFSPRFGIVYQPIDAVSLYASYTTSFAPSFGTSRNGNLSPFKPETGRQFEVGVKADLLKNLSATLAVYDLRKQNIVVDDPNSADPNDSIQVGEQASQGIEFDLAGEILPGWKIIASYGYTNAFISKDTTGFEGQQKDNVPKHTASLWSSYEIQKGSLRGLGFGLGVFFVGDRFGDLDNSYVLPGYVRTDAALFYKRDNWRVGLNVRNLFGQRYFTGSDGGRLSITVGEPITVIGSIGVEF
ncbi:TonB-dependent siderophore receptor [Altericista sp. CCNU0014]|uniref:TonB-dependent siderophore receptor n=1 Tax=Altericista sp. CCNU0014 TaxID=3082949 RepID=UPI00384EBD35